MRGYVVVYIHTYGEPDHLDFVPDLDTYGFDGYLVKEKIARDWCDTFNRYNDDRHAYYVG